MQRVVISDTSCLIALDHLNKLSILKSLFNSVIVSSIIAEEYGKPIPEFIAIKEHTNQTLFNELINSLDKGEASAIALASELDGAMLIIDEKKGRRVAGDLGIETIGTLRLILEAKRKGHIHSVKEALEILQRKNFRFSKDIMNEILRLSNEI